MGFRDGEFQGALVDDALLVRGGVPPPGAAVS